MDDFVTIHRKDKSSNSGGLCVYLSNQMVSVRLVDYEELELEIMWLQLSKNHKCIIFGVMYRNPRLTVDSW